MKFHELRSVLNSESTTCFTDGYKGSDPALPAVCPFAPIRVPLQHLQVDACNNVKNQLVGKAIRACSSFMTLQAR